MGAKALQLPPEQPQCPDGDHRIEQAKHQAGADQPQLRHQQQRKRQRHRQRAQVVEGQHLRDQVLERHIALEDAHHQRNLQPHQRADQQHHAVEQQAKTLGRKGIGHEQQRRQQPARQRHQQLDAQEMRGQLAHHKTRQVGANAHRKQVAADHRGELQHRIPQHVGRQRSRSQFVDQPASGDHKHAGQQRKIERARPCRRLSHAPCTWPAGKKSRSHQHR